MGAQTGGSKRGRWWRAARATSHDGDAAWREQEHRGDPRARVLRVAFDVRVLGLAEVRALNSDRTGATYNAACAASSGQEPLGFTCTSISSSGWSDSALSSMCPS